MTEDYEARVRNLEEEFRKYRKESEQNLRKYQERAAEVLGEHQNQINDLKGLISRLGERVVKLESRKTAVEQPKPESTERLIIQGQSSQPNEQKEGDYYEGVDLTEGI